MSNVLEVRNVRLAMGGQVILNDVSLDVLPGEIVALIGPNGAGKTSMFNCITRSYKPQTGAISYAGESLLGLPAHALAARGIARTFQGIELLPDRTALENVQLGAHVYLKATWVENLLALPRSRRREAEYRRAAMDSLDRVGLADVAQRRVRDLSYSRQKFVEIARCLVMKPKLLLLDEPVAGLSQSERKEALDLLAALREKEGLSILLVEHDLAFVRGLASRIVALDFGRVIGEGPPEQVLASPDLIRAYIGEAAVKPAGPLGAGAEQRDAAQ